MLLGVQTPVVNAPFHASLTKLTEDAQAPPGHVAGNGPVFVIGPEASNADIAANRLLADGADVSWATGPLGIDARTLAPGALVVANASVETMSRIAQDLKLDVFSLAKPPAVQTMKIRSPRLALYEPWGGNMDAGWTRWILEQHEFEYTRVRPADLRTPGLGERFDVIVLPEVSTSQILRGLQGRHIRPEYRGGIGMEGVQNLRRFVREGGTVITLGNAAQFAIEHLGVPAQNVLHGLDQEDFFCPGSLLRVAVDSTHPIAFGMPPEADAMFINNGAYRLTGSTALSKAATVVVSYPASGPLLRSGWIIGDARLRSTGAVLESEIGRGRVIMHTFRVQSRAQTWGTFKLLFNSIFYGAARPPRAPVGTSDISKN
jgi:hypothetical protein